MTLSETLIAALSEIQPSFYPDHYEAKQLMKDVRKRSRTRQLLDALATALVSQECNETIAVGSTVTIDHLILYVASNGPHSELNNIKNHLEFVWQCLKDIQRSIPPETLTSTALDGLPDELEKMHYKLRFRIYEFQAPRLSKRFSKAKSEVLDRFFDQVLADGSKYVRTRETETEVIRDNNIAFIYSDEIPLVHHLQALHILILQYLLSQTRDDLVTIAAGIYVSDCVFRVWGQKQGMSIFQERGLRNFFTRCDLICGRLGAEPQLVFFRQLWQKIFSLEHAVRHLVGLPHSKRLSYLLHRSFEVIPVPAQRIRLQYNMETDLDSHELFDTPTQRSSFLKCIGEISKCDDLVVPHPECTLLAFFSSQQNDKLEYIGLSKPPCASCLWYLDACNNIAPAGWQCSTRPPDAPDYVYNRYPGWVFPRTANDADIECYLLANAGQAFSSSLSNYLWKKGFEESGVPRNPRKERSPGIDDCIKRNVAIALSGELPIPLEDLDL